MGIHPAGVHVEEAAIEAEELVEDKVLPTVGEELDVSRHTLLGLPGRV